MTLRICRGCGCTDLQACPGGCSWVLMDFDFVDHDKIVPTPGGICSRCAEFWNFDPEMLSHTVYPEALRVAEQLGIRI